jgi:Protein of unknown function (DUF3224)
MPKLNGELTYSSWNEETYAEREGDRKLTRATVTQDLAGDLTGTGQVEWLMSYGDDGTAHFVGLQEFEGSIDGREGSAVLEVIGDYDGKEAGRGVRHPWLDWDARRGTIPGAARTNGVLQP